MQHKVLRFSIFFATMAATPAFAHFGHIADVAAHSHWVAVGAAAAAGVIIAVLGKSRDDKGESADQADQDVAEEDVQEGAA